MTDRIGNTIAEAYVIGDTTKKYYKWVPWEQPTMTSNTTYGNLKGSSEYTVSKVGTRYYFRMFDNNTTTTDGRINHWSPSNSVTAWWCWELPVKLKITKITVYGDNYYDSAANYHVVGQFYTDATKKEKVGEELVIAAKGQRQVIIIPDGIEVTALYFDKTGGGAYGGIEQIIIEATTPVEVAPGEDYDFTTDQPVIKLPAYKQKRKYYKRAFRPWNFTPALTSDTSNPDFIVSASSSYSKEFYPWGSFKDENVEGNAWVSAEGVISGWYQIQTTAKIRISCIKIENRPSSVPAAMRYFTFQGSLDGVDWEDIVTMKNSENRSMAPWWVAVNSQKAYYYHRFVISGSNNTQYVSLGYTTIYADEEYSKREVSSDDDWDFYEDEQEVLQAATYTHKRYFKRGTEPNLNMQVLGTTTIDNGVLNNINDAARLIIDRIPKQVLSYEMQFKVNFGGVFNDGRILGNYKTNICCPQIEGPVNATQIGESALRLAHSDGAGKWVTVDADNYLFERFKDYWIRAIWDGQAASIDVSVNGTDFVRTNSVPVDTCKWTEQAMIGVDVDAYATGRGTEIDLKESYIKINGEMWWRGTRPVECSEEEAEWSEWININKPIN